MSIELLSLTRNATEIGFKQKDRSLSHGRYSGKNKHGVMGITNNDATGPLIMGDFLCSVI